MSAIAYTNYPQTPERSATAAPLRAVPQRRARISVRSATVLVVSLVALIIIRLFVQVAVDASAYTIAELNRENVSLSRDAEFLTEQLNVLNSPQNVATMASQMGMVNNSRPAYLRLSDGMVWGDGAPAIGSAVGASSIANHLMLDLAAPTPNAGVAQSNEQATQAESVSQSSSATNGGIPAPATH
jgi:cell division protein FtsB